jgi:hypothetical protein
LQLVKDQLACIRRTDGWPHFFRQPNIKFLDFAMNVGRRVISMRHHMRAGATLRYSAVKEARTDKSADAHAPRFGHQRTNALKFL